MDRRRLIAGAIALLAVMGANVRLRPRSGRQARFRPDLRPSHLSPSTVAAIVARALKTRGTPWLVLAPHVSPEMGAELRAHQIPYIDRSGNSHIEGRRPPARDDVPRALRAESLRVIFGILARPDLVEAPVRETAQLVGVSKSTIANVLADLGRRGFIGKSLTRRQPLGATKLLDLWTAGYAATLRPRLVIGRFRSALRTPERSRPRSPRHGSTRPGAGVAARLPSGSRVTTARKR